MSHWALTELTYSSSSSAHIPIAFTYIRLRNLLHLSHVPRSLHSRRPCLSKMQSISPPIHTSHASILITLLRTYQGRRCPSRTHCCLSRRPGAYCPSGSGPPDLLELAPVVSGRLHELPQTPPKAAVWDSAFPPACVKERKTKRVCACVFINPIQWCEAPASPTLVLHVPWHPPRDSRQKIYLRKQAESAASIRLSFVAPIAASCFFNTMHTSFYTSYK